MEKTIEEKLDSLTQQVAELVEQSKQPQPTERDKVTQQLADAKSRKDIGAVISLSNKLVGMAE
ncbi:hypothetical protein ACX93W_12530 [Paenibacillus sp. CAU 1782]